MHVNIPFKNPTTEPKLNGAQLEVILNYIEVYITSDLQTKNFDSSLATPDEARQESRNVDFFTVHHLQRWFGALPPVSRRLVLLLPWGAVRSF